MSNVLPHVSPRRGSTSLASRFQMGVAALVLSSAGTYTAQAQTIGPLIREPDDVPGRRAIPEYTPIGYDFNGFDVLPSVNFGARFDDNVFTRTSVKKADVILQAEPRIRISKETSQHNITFDAMARSSTFLKLTDQDTTEYRVAGTYARGTTSPNSITVNVGYLREAIQRGTAENDIARGKPLMRRVAHASLTGRKQFNRLSVDAQVLGMRQSYEDLDDGSGVRVDQRFRNLKRLRLQGIASYELSARTALFVGLDYDDLNYAPSPTLVNRDARNTNVTAGVRYEVTRLLYAQLGVGHRNYDFKEPGLRTLSGLAVWGHLRYFPSRLLAIRGVIEQSNATSPFDLVSAVTLTTAKVEAEYEMRRSLSWLGSTRFTLEDYGRQPYSARRIEVSAGPKIRLNRWLAADASVRYIKRFVKGSAPFEPFSQFSAMISMTVAP